MTQLASPPVAFETTTHLHSLAAGWKFVLFRGLAAVAFGIVALAQPGIALATLIYLFAAFALLDGVFALAAAMSGRAKAVAPTWWLLMVGLFGIGAAAVTFAYPAVTTLMLLTFIGVWAVFRGIFEVVGAIQLRKTIDNEWWLILGGLLSIAFGAFVLIAPGAGALAMITVIAAYALVAGVFMIALSMRLKKHATRAS